MAFVNAVYSNPTLDGPTVSIFHSELASVPVADCISMLSDEEASISTCFSLAVGYNRLKDTHAVNALLGHMAGLPADGLAKQRYLCLASTLSVASLTTPLALLSSDTDAILDTFSKVDSHFHECDKIDQYQEVSWCTKGATYLQRYRIALTHSQADSAQDEAEAYLGRASYLFGLGAKEAAADKPIALPFYLGTASVAYIRGDYAGALANYCKAIELYGVTQSHYCSANVRVALGHTCYKLGQVDRALKCFERAIALDPGNTNAIVGKSIIELSTVDEDSPESRAVIESAIKALVTVPEEYVDGNKVENAMSDIVLADHLFFQWHATDVKVEVDESCNKVSYAGAGGSKQRSDFKVGQEVRIGAGFVTEIKSVDATGFTFSNKYSSSARKNVSVYIRDHSKVVEFAKRGYKNTMSVSIKSQACFIIGRVYHYHKDYTNAMIYYKQGYELDSNFIPGVYGYCKLLYKECDSDDDVKLCLDLLEKVISCTENCSDAYILKGIVLTSNSRVNSDNYNRGIECFRHGAKIDPKNDMLRGIYGSVLKNDYMQFNDALNEYKENIGLLENKGEEVDQVTLNNTAVLMTQNQCKDFYESEKLFKRALGMVDLGSGVDAVVDAISETSDDIVISLAFNLARLYEEDEKYGNAITIHKKIIKHHPGYISSYMRMGCICNVMGNMQECSEWLQQAMLVSPDNIELMCLIGDMWIKNQEWEPAQSIFDKVLREYHVSGGSPMEHYASIALGNIYLCNLNTAPDANRRDKFLGFASAFYAKVLRNDKLNLYAANGLGCVMACKGELGKAKDIFTRVRESSGDNVGCVFLNMGHLYLAQGKHAESIKSYEHYLSKFAAKKEYCRLHMFLAYAHFDWAKLAEENTNAASSDAQYLDERYRDSLSELNKAAAMEPSNTLVAYNIAVTRMEFALAVLGKGSKGQRRTLADVEGAGANLNEAEKIFRKLIAVGGKNKAEYDADKARDYADHIKKVSLMDWENHRAHEAGLEDEENMKRALQRAEAEEIAEKHKLKVMEDAAALAAEKERKIAIAAANEKKAKDLVDRLKILGANATKRGGGKKKKGESDPNVMADDTDSDSSDDEPAAKGGTPAATAAAAATNADLFGEDSDDDDGLGDVGDGGAGGDDSDDDEDEFKLEEGGEEEEGKEGATVETTEAPKKKKTIQDLFDSDSDDEKDGKAEETAAEEAAPSAKKRKVIDDDDDE
jgi:tetratricopeptide (TPR) repeat protein